MDKKKELLVSVEELVTDILKNDIYKENSTNCSVFLKAEQQVTIGYGGKIVEVDNNNMALLEFDDYIGTTDWLPLGIFETSVITSLYDVLSNIFIEVKAENLDDVFALYKHDVKNKTIEVVKVFDNMDDVVCEIKALELKYNNDNNLIFQDISYNNDSLSVRMKEDNEYHYYVKTTKFKKSKK